MLTIKNKYIHLTPDQKDIPNFNPSIAAVACFLSSNEKLLLLKNNNPNKFQYKRWGVPGGKVEFAENPEDAILRELHEETAVLVSRYKLEFIVKLYVRIGKLDYEFFVYRTNIYDAHALNIILNDNEHSDYSWVYPKAAIEMDLILGEKELINYIFLNN